MEKISLGEGLMAQMMENEAWRLISKEHPFSLDQLEKYADRIDWEELSCNGNVFWTIPMLEKFKSRLNWRKLINNYSLRNWDVEAFFRKYEDRIPVSDFKDSRLWDELVEKKEIELRHRMLLG